MRSAAILVLVLLVFAASWFGKQAYTVYQGITKTTHHVVKRRVGEPTVVIPPINSNQRINILLLGSDNDQKSEEKAPLTQSMIVVTIDPRNDKVGLLSIPRDFWVPIPGHGYAKIDLAFKYGYQKGGMAGGVALARDTVERLFHIPIDYYAWVGLQGFSKVIDTFNGVTLDVQHPVLDDTYPNDIRSPDPYGYRRIFIPAGWQHMDGTSALEYVRSRHGDKVGDFGRSARQQQILLQIRQKANAMNVLQRLPDLVLDLQDSVLTDLDLTQLYQLNQLSHHIARQDIRQVVLSYPTYCDYGWSPDHTQSILTPFWGKIMPVVRSMFAPISQSSPQRAARAAPTATRAARKATADPAPTTSPIPKPTDTPTAQQIHSLPGSLIYVSKGDVYELSSRGSSSQLTYSGDAAMPQPAPDGRTLAYVRFTNGFHRYDKYASDVWLMNLTSHQTHVITHDESSTAANNLWAAWPSWSPDGSRILFSTDRGKLNQAPSDIRPVDFAVWSMAPTGAGAAPITRPQQGAGGDTEPSWRPHTRLFVYVAWNYLAQTNKPYSQLVLSDPTTHRGAFLTPVGGRVLQPAWDPSGRLLTFIQTGRNGLDQVVVATVQGSRLTNERVLAYGKVGQPAFTPGGRSVSYLRADGDGFSLYLQTVKGGPERQVIDLPNSVDARWRPVWVR